MELDRQHKYKKLHSARANANATANSAVDLNKCRYCGFSHGRGEEPCPAYGNICRSCGTANHFTKVCMKSKRKEGKVHSPETNTDEGNDSSQDINDSECI